MGEGVGYICPKCGHEQMTWQGVGMMYPQVCEKFEEKFRNGEFGEERQKLVKNYKIIDINCEMRSYFCPTCKNFQSQHDLTLTCLEPLDQSLPQYVCLPMQHKCEKCGTEMQEHKGQTVLCSKCNTPLKPSGLMVDWD